MADKLEPISPDLLAKLQELAEAAKGDYADHATHEAADATLSVLYDKEGKWRINYILPRKAVIGVNNRQCAEVAKAQIRGMLSDFAFRQTTSLQARVEALEKALEMGRELVKKHTAADSKGYRDWDVDEWLEAARKLLDERGKG